MPNSSRGTSLSFSSGITRERRAEFTRHKLQNTKLLESFRGTRGGEISDV